jgi:uncharacterized protein YhaN
MKRFLPVSLAVLGLFLAACGGQCDQEKATNDVCDARADIKKNVEELQNLTLGTATADQIQSNLNGIRDGFVKIGDARANLDGARKRQVEKANETFQSEVQKLVADLGKSTSLNDAAAQLKKDISSLATAYQDSLGPINCD